MTQAQITRWKRTRERGRKRYVLHTGVFWWGGFMTVSMSAIQYWMNPETFGVVRNLGTNLLIYSIGGLIFGVWTWATSEKAYSKHLLLGTKESEQDVTPNA